MQLARMKFKRVTLAVSHLSQLIMAFLGDGSRLGVHIDYSKEDEELGTIGPLTLIDDLPENFLVMNGDILCNMDYKKFLNAHVKNGSQISISAYPRKEKIDFGVLRYDKNNQLTEFKEKPVLEIDVSMGVFCLNRSIIELLPRGVPYGFDNLMIDSLKKGLKIDILPFSGYWLDIGRPDDYDYANSKFPELLDKLGI